MEYPGVGTAVWVHRDGKVLMGLRKGKVGAGLWCPPGGKLDMYEAWESCALRETREETDLEVEGLKFVTVTNDPHPEVGSHYVTVVFVADAGKREVRLMEPDKFERWEWFDWNALPAPLFWATQDFVELGLNPLNF